MKYKGKIGQIEFTASVRTWAKTRHDWELRSDDSVLCAVCEDYFKTPELAQDDLKAWLDKVGAVYQEVTQ